MSCDAVQRGLLGLARPNEPPVALHTHLAACPVCHAYHQRLVELERRIPELPVPASTTKDALLRQILDEPEAVTERPRTLPIRPGWKIRERARRKLALAAALAATLAMFAVGWAVWQHEAQKQQVTQLVNQLRPIVPKSAEELREARTPRERVEALARVADSLFEQSTKMRSRDPNNPALAEVAGLYREVVEEFLPKQADALSSNDKAVVLPPIVARLARVRWEAEQLTNEMEPGPAASLRTIGNAARDAEQKLQKLVEAA